MYKVFINEKSLTLSRYPYEIEKKLRYEGFATLEIAIDLLENTSCPEINVYGEDLEEIWEDFTHMFKVIEAAGGLVKNSREEILCIHRLGKWDLPKGKIENGESLEQAALREVQEETGLEQLAIDSFINSTFHTYTERSGVRILKTTYWFHMTYFGDKTPVPQLEEGITKVEWKSHQDLVEQVVPSTFKNIELILIQGGILEDPNL